MPPTSLAATPGLPRPEGTMTRRLVLVRHPEARKNMRGALGGGQGDDDLSPVGFEQCAQLSSNLSAWLRRLGLSLSDVTFHRSSDLRARAASDEIAHCLQFSDRAPSDAQPPLIGWVTHSGLSSIKKGSISGLTDEEIRAYSPGYAEQVNLYRNGLANSYGIHHPGEGLRAFEKRVLDSLRDIVASPSPVQLVVAHRSSITAILIHYARVSHGYPNDYYGYVEIPLASSSIVETSPARRILTVGAYHLSAPRMRTFTETCADMSDSGSHEHQGAL
jgi:broad specificity phosphatase PhoE